jgi:hypothetical protein
VFVSAIVAGNVSTIGGLSLGCLLLTSATLLGLCNYQTKNLQMFGRTLNQEGPPKAYHHRLDSARELIAKSGKDDWRSRWAPGDTTIPLLESSIVPGTLIVDFIFMFEESQTTKHSYTYYLLSVSGDLAWSLLA